MGIEFLVFGTILSGISSMFFGLRVYMQNRNTVYGIVFFLFNISFSFWLLTYSFGISQSDPEAALFWARVRNFGVIWMPVFFMHWVITFSNVKKQYKRLILIAGYTSSLFFALMSFSPFFIESVRSIGQLRFWPNPGILHKTFMITNFII